MAAWFMVILVGFIIVPVSLGQSQTCSQAYECANQTTPESHQTSSLFNNGYKSHYGSSSFMTSTQPVYCNGAYSCAETSLISTSMAYCHGALSCSKVSNIHVNTPTPTPTEYSVMASGANAIAHATVSNAQIECSGEQGCAHSIIHAPGELLMATGAYSLLNATIDSVNGASTITIVFLGYYSGFGTNIICRTGQTCIIHCPFDDVVCTNLNLNCSNNCEINGNPYGYGNISPQDVWPYDSLIIVQTNDALCSSQVDAMRFDGSVSSVSNTLANTQGGPICCRGYQSCLSKNIQYTSVSNESIICSGQSSCSQSEVYSYGPVFCSGHYSCSDSSIITTATIYCQADFSCAGASISGSSTIYCGAARSCYQSVIQTNGVDLNLHLTGYHSAHNATVYCNSSDHCSIFCQGQDACYNLNVVCDGTCTISPPFQATCPFNIAGCSTTNTCTTCHETCEYCQCTACSQTCGALDCMTCATGYTLNVIYSDGTGQCTADATIKPYTQDTTDEPPETTKGPQDTTDEPPETTKGPQDTTDEPPETTKRPQDTTDEPQDSAVNALLESNLWMYVAIGAVVIGSFGVCCAFIYARKQRNKTMDNAARIPDEDKGAIGEDNADLIMCWLSATIGLPQYYATFMDNGYNSLDFISNISTKEELNDIGIKIKGHQTQLMVHIKQLKEAAEEQQNEGLCDERSHEKEGVKQTTTITKQTNDMEQGIVTKTDSLQAVYVTKSEDENGKTSGLYDV
eukprot:737455_1